MPKYNRAAAMSRVEVQASRIASILEAMEGLSDAYDKGIDLQRWVNELIGLSRSYGPNWFQAALELFEKIDEGSRS